MLHCEHVKWFIVSYCFSKAPLVLVQVEDLAAACELGNVQISPRNKSPENKQQQLAAAHTLKDVV